MNHDEDHLMNNANNNNDQRENPSSDSAGNDNGHTTRTESYVFTGNPPAFLTTVQNVINRIIMRDQQPEQRENTSNSTPSQSTDEDTDMRSVDDDDDVNVSHPIAESQTGATAPVPITTSPLIASESGTSSTPSTNDTTTQPSPQNSDQLPNAPSNPSGRPIRPLPRGHSHFHAHTPFGVIDLFAFNVNMTAEGPASPPELPPPHAPPLTATFTFNLAPEAFAGFEAMFLNHLQKEREPDPERAKTLLRGMQIVSDGLVRRLERAGGVPGGQGTEDHSSGCAVCWGPLLEGVEPGEWDSASQKEEKEKHAAEAHDAKGQSEEDEFRGRIVALPCAHVFHAECLLPWFSRNTTCPTCRFDIDPESLTWNPQPPPAPPETEPPEDDVPAPEGFPFNLTREEVERLNAAEAERFNTFITSFFRGTAGGNQGRPHAQQQPQQQQQQPQPSGQEEYQQRVENDNSGTSNRPTGESRTQAEAVPSQTIATSSSSTSPATSPPATTSPSDSSNPPRLYRPAPPQLPPPRLHNLPTLFRLPPTPLLLFPTRPSGIPAQGQPRPVSQPSLPETNNQPPSQPEVSIRDAAQAQPTPETTQATPAPVPSQPSQPSQPQQPPPQQQQHPGLPPFLNLPHFYPGGFHVFQGAGAGTALPAQEQPARPANANANTPPFPHFPPPYHFPPFGNDRTQQPGAPRARRQWVPPEPLGRTLRQRVEAKERELGLRCEDVVCLFAPTDEDPVPAESLSDNSKGTLKRRVQLHGAYDARGHLCEHSFHPACLVASARIRGLDDEEVDMAGVDGDGADEREIEISCPVCRANGTLSHKEWQEGVRSLQETS